MLKIDRSKQRFSILDTPTLADVSITERYDLQEFICNSPDAFFKEIGQKLFLLGKEVEPSKNVQDRIDVLAVDKEGAAVVLELKRGTNKLQMLQAISYAGMISQWGPDDFLQLLSDDQQEALADFLEVDTEEINRQQKIILIAEAFDYALLIGAEWLSDQYSVDITCCRIAVAKDAGTESEYLVCSNVFPAPELAHEAVPRGRKKGGSGKLKWADWETALSAVENPAVVSYYEGELATNRESYLRKRILHYRLQGKRRWFAAARKSKAYVWQHGRFDNDIDFWKKGLGETNDVKAVKDGKCLSFFLASDDDFRYFHQAATETLQPTDWLETLAEDEIEDAEVAEA